MIIACGFFIPVFYEYLQTGLVEKFPTLIMCGFVGIAALLSFFSGLILSSEVQKNKQEYEWKLIQVSNLKKFTFSNKNSYI